MVVDYRGLKEQTEDDSYSLPLIDSILQKQHKKRIFTVLDLKHGYHQMPLHEDSRPCTAMSTPLEPMQWKVVPMGAKNGNAAFQRMMEDLLNPFQIVLTRLLMTSLLGRAPRTRPTTSSSRRMRRTCAEYWGSWTSTAWCASPQRPHSL